VPPQRREEPSPLGVFSEVFILKSFKFCVLEVRIPKGLRAGFAEVRIIKDLVASGECRVVKLRKEIAGARVYPPPGCFL